MSGAKGLERLLENCGRDARLHRNGGSKRDLHGRIRALLDVMYAGAGARGVASDDLDEHLSAPDPTLGAKP
jgi:hypothetical protein